jgi:predicted lipoprotein with Yx(FWY)xxD motif
LREVFWKLVLSSVFFIMPMRPGEALGAWPDDPETNVPICTAQGTQEHPRIATDGASGAIIVWQDISSSSSDIYAQRVDARGIVRWTKDGVAICLEKGEQWHPNLVYDGAGGVIMAWWDKRGGYAEMDIYAQRINGDGEVQWQPGGVPICTAPKFQQELDITADGEGGAIITWHDYRSESNAPYIYAQRINAEGKSLWEHDGVLVAGQVGYQKYPTLASDGAGGAIVAWEDWRDGKGDIYMQRVGANGQTLWQENGLPMCKMPERQWRPNIIAGGKGGAIIVWMDHRNDEEDAIISRADYRSGIGWDIYAQRVDAQGNPQWQVNGIPVCLALGDQYDYSIVGDGADGAFITWHDQRSGKWDIYAQRLDGSGNAKWTKDGLPVCTEPQDQYNPSIVSDGVDGVIITWWDKREVYGDIYAQRIDAGGNLLWVEGGAAICIAGDNQQDPRPINSGVGSAIITWWDKRKVDADIYVQRVFSE